MEHTNTARQLVQCFTSLHFNLLSIAPNKLRLHSGRQFYFFFYFRVNCFHMFLLLLSSTASIPFSLCHNPCFWYCVCLTHFLLSAVRYYVEHFRLGWERKCTWTCPHRRDIYIHSGQCDLFWRKNIFGQQNKMRAEFFSKESSEKFPNS